jgi:tripartite motif-containing protein 71
MNGPTPLITLAVVLALVMAGCANGGPAAKTAGAAGSASSAPGVPNPFTIAARYDARSLGLTNPRSLAIGPDGNLYVTDASQRVSVISPGGHVLRRWGRPGSGPGEFSFVAFDSSDPKDIHARIAVGANGLVYVSDSGNRRVEVFTPTGTFVRQIGFPGRSEGHLIAPFDVAVDEAGDVFVADDELLSVTKFSPDGRFLWRIGGGISADPDLQGHEHLSAVDAHGRLVMANDDTGAVLYVDASGHVVDRFHQVGCDVSVDALGNTYVNDCDGRIHVFDRDHRPVGVWDSGAQFSPRFGPGGEPFLLNNGTIMRLRIALPGR